MPGGSKIVVHIVPVDNFSTNAPIDFGPVRQNHGLLIAPLNSGGSVRVNLEGQIALCYRSDQTVGAYAQLFRHGALELGLELINSCTLTIPS